MLPINAARPKNADYQEPISLLFLAGPTATHHPESSLINSIPMHHEQNQTTQDPRFSNPQEKSDCPDMTGVGDPAHPDLSTS